MAPAIRFLLIYLAAFGCVASFGIPQGETYARIIGGQESSMGEFPYLVSIQDISLGTNRHFCGGAIYSDSYILTAAHCTIDISLENIKIVAGEFDRSVTEGNEQTSSLTEIIIHPNFNLDTYLNDIAILRLTQKLHFNTFVKAIDLSSQDTSAQFCEIAGWGATEENGIPVNVIRKVTLPLWDEQSCGNFLQVYCPSCIGVSLCAGAVDGGLDACHGDDGGPMVCSGTDLIGLSSWGYGCGRAEKPGVYVELMHYKQWIETMTNKRQQPNVDS